MMNKQHYIQALDGLQIRQDFNNKTFDLMKRAVNKPMKKNISTQRIILTFASIALVVSAGATAVYFGFNNGDKIETANLAMGSSEIENASTYAVGITIPEIALPEVDSASTSMMDMIGLFVYQGRIYVQSNSSFEQDKDYQYNKEDILNLRGDYLGKTKGTIDEWSKQEDYAAELASTIGDAEIYTVKGYDSKYRLMAYWEYEDGGFNAEIYDSFGGLTMHVGSAFFNILQLRGNVDSLLWQDYDSWNNGRIDLRTSISVEDTFNKFLDALYESVPVGDLQDKDMFTTHTDDDSQKFVYIKTKDNIVTPLRLFNDGYVYFYQAGFFKIEDSVFKAFWDTLPVSQVGTTSPVFTAPAVTEPITANPGSSATDSKPPLTAPAATGPETVNPNSSVNAPNISVTLKPSKFSVGTKTLTLKLKNNGTEEVYYGMDYIIEQLINEKWVSIPQNEDMAFIMIAASLPAGEEQDFNVDLSLLNPQLTVGKYRVAKNVGGEQFYAEFELN